MPLVIRMAGRARSWSSSTSSARSSDPVAHGGDAADAFHVVCPSLPGYGFSDKPAAPGWGVERIADAWIGLMARLGYARYGAQGGDWGTSVSTCLGQHATRARGRHPSHCRRSRRPIRRRSPTSPSASAPRSPRSSTAAEWDAGYSTRARHPPADDRLRARRLAGRPVRLDRGEVLGLDRRRRRSRGASTRDQLLDNLMLYWLPAHRRVVRPALLGEHPQVNEWISGAVSDTIDVPTGCSIFPQRAPAPLPALGRAALPDIRHWNELDRGGHFAAFEQPELFVDELRAFFRLVRCGGVALSAARAGRRPPPGRAARGTRRAGAAPRPGRRDRRGPRSRRRRSARAWCGSG